MRGYVAFIKGSADEKVLCVLLSPNCTALCLKANHISSFWALTKTRKPTAAFTPNQALHRRQCSTPIIGDRVGRGVSCS